MSVVIPAYNEEKRIGKTVSEVHSFFQKKGMEHEIIVVDDGSTDHTREVAGKAGKPLRQFRVLEHENNLGKGVALKTGVMKATGDWILITDADLSVPLGEFDKLWKTVREGYDVAIASRSKGATILRSQGVLRGSFGKLFRLFVKLLVIGGVSDTQCGFKLFERRIGQRAFSQVVSNGVLTDIEFLLAAHQGGAKIREIPVVWSHNPETKIPYTLFSSLAVFWELLLIKMRWRIILPYNISKG